MPRRMTQLFLKPWIFPAILCALLGVLTTHAKATPDAAPALQCFVFLSDNTQYIDDWYQLPAGTAPHIKSLGRASMRVPLFLGMVAYVPKELSGKRNLRVTVKLVAPDGETVIDLPNYREFEANIPGDGGYVLIEPPLDLHFAETDLPGNWHAYGVVTDIVSGTRAHGNYQFIMEK